MLMYIIFTHWRIKNVLNTYLLAVFHEPSSPSAAKPNDLTVLPWIYQTKLLKRKQIWTEKSNGLNKPYSPPWQLGENTLFESKLVYHPLCKALLKSHFSKWWIATEHLISLVWSVIWQLPGNACPLLVHQPCDKFVKGPWCIQSGYQPSKTKELVVDLFKYHSICL